MLAQLVEDHAWNGWGVGLNPTYECSFFFEEKVVSGLVLYCVALSIYLSKCLSIHATEVKMGR